jgi:hypothetical protein
LTIFIISCLFTLRFPWNWNPRGVARVIVVGLSDDEQQKEEGGGGNSGGEDV